jgi:putative flippase GtrA
MSLRRQFSVFFLVGLSATAVHYAILVILRELAGWPVNPATLLGFVCGGGVSYTLNRRHTFASDRPHAEAGWRFIVVTSIGFLMTWALMTLLVNLFGDRHYLLEQAATTGTVMFWNFGANRIWTFRAQPPEAGGEVA